jgi:hypothetical protein
MMIIHEQVCMGQLLIAILQSLIIGESFTGGVHSKASAVCAVVTVRTSRSQQVDRELTFL